MARLKFFRPSELGVWLSGQLAKFIIHRTAAHLSTDICAPHLSRKSRYFHPTKSRLLLLEFDESGAGGVVVVVDEKEGAGLAVFAIAVAGDRQKGL